jgi:CubicO group peptidase (beta-lactamase class C family)
MIGRRLLAIATAICLLDGGAAAQTARPPPAASPAQATATESAYTAAFDAWRTANDPQTAILVVQRGGKTVFVAGHNTDGNGPSFIGSMSKAITGACVATLIRDGKLSFTTPMREALADFFKRNGRPLDRRFENVTVEQLLTHRSGLHDNGHGDPFLAIRRERIAQHLADVSSPQAMLVPYLAEQSLVSAPGSTYAYPQEAQYELSVK